jgi:UDP-glucose 4-epimerase
LRSGPVRYVVTGGAGFVGSHVVLALLERGASVVVLDNLSQGHREAVPAGVELVVADLADHHRIDALLAREPWDAVLHFASLSLVNDSMLRPFQYFIENACNGIHLIDSCVRQGVGKFVLSSTANLFGTPDQGPISENSPLDPCSPYGESKWMIERALRWAEQVHGLRHACLRYFSAAGADPLGRAGEDHTPETHLIPLVIDAALGRRRDVAIFGDDYPTPDGTCVRDYIHVTDLATAHLLALDRLEQRSVTYNLGNGAGYSVLQVIQSVERVTGRPVPTRIAPRRAGDPALLVSASDLIKRETGWTPQFADLDDMVRTAYVWRQAHPDGYASLPASVSAA